MLSKYSRFTVLALGPLAALAAACSGAASGDDPVGGSTAADTTNQTCEQAFGATDGATTFTFDYQLQATDSRGVTADSYLASPSITVRRGSFTGKEQVSVTVLQFAQNPGSNPVQTSTSVVALAWNGKAFAANLQGPLPTYEWGGGGMNSDSYTYQFALDVAGTWLTDPMTGTHNFNFWAAAAKCAPVPTVDAGPGHVDAAPDHVDAAPDHVDAAPDHVDAAPGHVDAAPAPVDAGPAPVITPGTEWCHDYFSASDGTTTVHFDYEVEQTVTSRDLIDYANKATPAWLNVSSGKFTGKESAQAVAIALVANMEEPSYLSWSATVQVPLSWNGSNFTGQIADGLPLYNYVEGEDVIAVYAYQFSVVVDGTWLTDPVSGTHNFQYFPYLQGADATCKGIQTSMH